MPVVICEELESCNTVFRYTFLPAGYSVLRCYGSCCIHNANKTSDSCLRTLNTNLASYLPCNGRPPALHWMKGGEKSHSERETTGLHCADVLHLQRSVGYSRSGIYGTRMCWKQSATASYSEADKSVHTFTRYSFDITFNIILPSTLRSNECFLPVTTLDLSYI
jgi:hypothetical protein